MSSHTDALGMDALRSAFLFTLWVRVGRGWEIQRPQAGERLSIWAFEGGHFEGPRLRGEVLPVGGDWASVRSDRLVHINVAGVMRAVDQALISFRYEGLWATSPGVLGRVVAPGGHALFSPDENYLRVTAKFETDAPRYAWLNEIIAIGVGRRVEDGVMYTFHEVL